MPEDDVAENCGGNPKLENGGKLRERGLSIRNGASGLHHHSRVCECAATPDSTLRYANHA